MDAVCLIAAPGAGTDALCRVLAQCPDLAAHDRVFDPREVRGIGAEGWPLLSRLTGVRFGRADDPKLLSFVRDRPAAWLDAVESADHGKRLMVFSLTHDDLPAEAFSTFIHRPGLRVVLVMRKQIEGYAAALARHARSTHGAGSRVRPKVDIGRFEQWLDTQERWYGHWQAWLKRYYLPCPILRYETDIDQPAGRVLRRAAAAVAQVGVTIRIPATARAADVEPAPRPPLSETVANWDEVNREIFARGLERRAFGYPLQNAA